MSKLYEFILFNRNGTPIADISKICHNRSYSLQRNRAENLSFDIPLNKFEQFAEQNGLFSKNMLEPLSTEVKVKRNGVWKFGAVVGESPVTLSENEMKISVNCYGYLDSLADRYVTPGPYLGVEGTQIAWDLINNTQLKTHGDLYMSQGPSQAVTMNRDRTDYRYQNVKDAIINLSNLSDIGFDFEFTHDKKFNTYNKIGSDFSDLLIIYPGNIINMQVPRSGVKTYNSIYALGSGFDEDQVSTYVEDTDSQINLVRREKIQTWNSVVDVNTLQENANAYLTNHCKLLEIPQFTLSGKDFDLNKYGVGDRLSIKVVGHTFVNPETVQRIEKIDVSIDENDSEVIKIYFEEDDENGS